MDNNRKIAEWAGWAEWERDKDGWWSVPGIGRKTNPPDLAIPSVITLWHSTLFPLIEERGLVRDFVRTTAGIVNKEGVAMIILSESITPGGIWEALWPLVKATPAQLTESLVRTIEEE